MIVEKGIAEDFLVLQQPDFVFFVLFFYVFDPLSFFLPRVGFCSFEKKKTAVAVRADRSAVIRVKTC